MVKVKNVRPGIVIIADAGLKLWPGEVADMARLTPQAEKAIEDGLLARIDMEPEPRQRVRGAAKTDEPAKQSDTKTPEEQDSDFEGAKVDSGAKNGAG